MLAAFWYLATVRLWSPRYLSFLVLCLSGGGHQEVGSFSARQKRGGATPAASSSLSTLRPPPPNAIMCPAAISLIASASLASTCDKDAV